MDNPEFVLENKTNKLFCDFVIEADHLISARGSDLVIDNNKKKKRTGWKVDFVISPDNRVKLKESEKRDKYLNLARELKKAMEHDGDSSLGTFPKRMVKENRRLGNQKTSGDHPDYSIIKISQNTWKSLGDLRRLSVSQTPVKKAIS